MRILITGATGFIGHHLIDALHARGHEIVACVHRARPVPERKRVRTRAVDYMRDVEPVHWLDRLQGVDAVINAVGILRESGSATFRALHEAAPQALFAACGQTGVRRVIQISALGAEPGATSAYHRSKLAADNALRNSDLDWTVVQPSLVFGTDGASTRLFLQLAALPVTPLVGPGTQPVQPIHVDDLALLVTRLVEDDMGVRETVPAVGREPVSFRDLLAGYRRQLGLGPMTAVTVPVPVVRIGARLGDLTGHGALSSETLAMLLQGNTGPVERTQQILGRRPRPGDTFIAPDARTALRLQAQWPWVRGLFLVALAVVWIGAGITSLFFGREYGLELLTRLGLPAALAPAAFYAACAVDLAFGVLTLLRPGRLLWLAQLAVIAFYTLALTVVAPALWADPFGPLVKNLPIGALLVGLLTLDRER